MRYGSTQVVVAHVACTFPSILHFRKYFPNTAQRRGAGRGASYNQPTAITITSPTSLTHQPSGRRGHGHGQGSLAFGDIENTQGLVWSSATRRPRSVHAEAREAKVSLEWAFHTVVLSGAFDGALAFGVRRHRAAHTLARSRRCAVVEEVVPVALAVCGHAVTVERLRNSRASASSCEPRSASQRLQFHTQGHGEHMRACG